MSAGAYYNELDREKAAWLVGLIKAGVIAPGDVDTRSIKDVQPADLVGYTQCHFFAGIGVWSYSLRLAGWPDDRPVWTGSCPCPSFSCAGKGEGFDDPRHLWPHWARLIRECKPPTVFGEQADDAIGFGWLDLVQTDLEAEAYSVGKAVLGAASVGASDIRQRLYFVAHAAGGGYDGRRAGEKSSRIETAIRGGIEFESQRLHDVGGMAETDGRQPGNGDVQSGGKHGLIAPHGGSGFMGIPPGAGRQGLEDGRSDVHGSCRPTAERAGCEPSGSVDGRAWASPLKGFWRDADWLFCRDGKWRPVEPGTFPLAHGATSRLGRLRGYGDAINAYTAKAFIESVMEIH